MFHVHTNLLYLLRISAWYIRLHHTSASLHHCLGRTPPYTIVWDEHLLTPLSGTIASIHHCLGRTPPCTIAWDERIHTPLSGTNAPIHHCLERTPPYTISWDERLANSFTCVSTPPQSPTNLPVVTTYDMLEGGLGLYLSWTVG